MDHKDDKTQSTSSPLTAPLLSSTLGSSSGAGGVTDDDPSSTTSTTTATTSNVTTIHQGESIMRSSSSAATGAEAEAEDQRMSFVEELLRTVAKLVMILFGLSVVLTIFFWPSFLVPRLAASIPNNSGNKPMTTVGTTLLVQLLHIMLLIYVDIYLYVHRFIALPVRIPLMPLLNVIVESEAKREKNATVWYNDCRTFPKIPAVVGATSSHQSGSASSSSSRRRSDDGDALSTLLTGGFKASTRRDIKQKLRYYNERRITSTTQHSNWMSLRRDVPLIWEHQRKQVRRRRRRGGQSLHGENTGGNDNNSNDNLSVPLGELLDAFLSRFLVIFLVPHAYIDRYYCPIDAVVLGDGETTAAAAADTTKTEENRRQRLVAMGMFVACDHVLIYNMYFSVDDPVINSAGIWQYNHIRGLLRAVISHNIGGDCGGNDNDDSSDTHKSRFLVVASSGSMIDGLASSIDELIGPLGDGPVSLDVVGEEGYLSESLEELAVPDSVGVS